MKLFDDDWGVDQSPEDDTEIKTTPLYFSKDELREFKKLCKLSMKKRGMEDSNVPDLLLTLLREENEKNDAQEGQEQQTGRETEGEVPSGR